MLIPPTRCRSLALIATAFLLPLLQGDIALHGQDKAAPAATDFGQRAVELKARIEASSSQLNEEQTKTATASLAIVESNVGRLAASTSQADANRKLLSDADSRTEKLRKKAAEETVAPFPKGDLSELEAAKERIDGQLSESILELKKVQEALSTRNGVAKTNTQRISQLIQQVNELETQQKAAGDIKQNQIVNDAKNLELQSTIAYTKAELERLKTENELFATEEKAGWLVAANEHWSALSKRLRETQEQLNTRIEDLRRQETKKSVTDAKAEVDNVPASLRPFAEETAQIAERAEELLKPIETAKRELKVELLKLDQLRKQFESTENRVKTVGLTSSVGAYLRNRKAEIPREDWLASTMVDQLSQIETFQSSQFDLQESLQNLLTDEVVAKAIEGLESKPEKENVLEIEKVKEAAVPLVARRRELLTQAISKHKDLLDSLGKRKQAEIELDQLTSQFHEYINERILWIRSNELLFSEFKSDDSDDQLRDTKNWQSAAVGLVSDVKQHLFLYAFTALAVALLFLRRGRLRIAITERSEIVLRGTNTSFLPTLETVLLTVVIALPIPLLLLMFGWRMTAVATSTVNQFAFALGQALIATGMFFFLAELLRQVVRPKGLAEAHFRWPESGLKKLNREMSWFVPVAAIFAFVCSLLYTIDTIHQSDTIERVVYIVALGALTTFLYRSFHPAIGVFREWFAANPKMWLTQTNKMWFWMLLAVPATLIVMIVVGYYYSAIQMLSRLFWTVVFVVGLELLRSLVMKFVSLSRRRARIQQARARLAAQSSNEATKTAKANELERVADQEAFIASENEALDENVIRSQKLVTAGVAIACTLSLFMIWSDVFPALKGLDRFVFWTTTVERVAESQPGESGPTSSFSNVNPAMNLVAKSQSAEVVAVVEQPTIKEVRAVTLRNFLLAIVVLGISIFAVKNLPAFVELVFLKHLPMEQSLRHAIRAISGYIILMIGIIAAGRVMYIGWSQIQWLATALTFGLAFGLQEIFANFIAGIILLLERPIRIGDIVEVGEVRGTVTRIRIRATTIRNFDQKDFIVPNKEFITGRLLNWTLSDKVVRQTLRVGIAYGSDVREAKKIILDICERQPAVLSDPTPFVTFEEFADSSLNLTARIHLKDFDSWWPTMDDINLQIDDAFKAAGIEISFPQRDLHIRTASPEFASSLARVEQREKPRKELDASLNGIQQGKI